MKEKKATSKQTVNKPRKTVIHDANNADLNIFIKAAALMPEDEAKVYVTERAGHLFDQQQTVSINSLQARLEELHIQKAQLVSELQAARKAFTGEPHTLLTQQQTEEQHDET